ncbi:hypothetical protein PPTS312_12870 [Pseudomonas putida]|uniref:Transposase n=1 Tax=Pseudomonas putida TaxID=303 RepID=A0A7U6LZW3_PSEPU|nr:hypothetical protein PPTS312_12870 [Pseudomonas putida]
MLARLAGNAAHLKMMGAFAPGKTATKSDKADGQRLVRGFGWVFSRFMACPRRGRGRKIETPRQAGAFWGSHGVFQVTEYPTDAALLAGSQPCWH